MIAQGSQKINRRSKLAVDLTEVNAQLVALSNIVTFQDAEITSLSNDIASLSNDYYPFKTCTNAKITSLQEFGVVFYGDLRNLDNKIEALAISHRFPTLLPTIAYNNLKS